MKKTRIVRALLASACFPALLTAQSPPCALVKSPDFGFPGITELDGPNVKCVQMYDPDGSGPLAPRALFGGDFNRAGNVLYEQPGTTWIRSSIAAWDPSNRGCLGFGDGVEMIVYGTCAGLDGRVYVIGAGYDHSAPEVLQWDGTSWSVVGTPGGGGLFTCGFYGGYGGSLATLANGDVLAGPVRVDQTTPEAQREVGVSRWDGVSWSWVGGFFSRSGGTLFYLDDIVELANGDVIAVGDFTAVDCDSSVFPTVQTAAANIARWDGATWQPLGAGCNDRVRSVVELPNGDLLVGGDFTAAGSVAADHVARWDGSAWHAVPNGAFQGRVCQVGFFANGDLLAAGEFTVANGATADRFARYDGSSWSSLGSGFDDGIVQDFSVLPDGRLIAVGSFRSAGGRSCIGGAVWSGTTWEPINYGSINVGTLGAVATTPAGELYAAGSGLRLGGFELGTTAVARFDGESWQQVGAGLGGEVHDLDVFDDGRLLVAGRQGQHRVQVFDGSDWTTPYGNDINITRVVSAELRPNGHLAIAGGQYSSVLGTVGGSAFRGFGYFDGNSWTDFSSVANYYFGDAYDITTTNDGRLLVVGFFSVGQPLAGRSVAIWDGTSWEPLASWVSGTVYAGAQAPNGDVFVGGAFDTIEGVTCNNVARFDGVNWHALDDGVAGTDGPVTGLTVLPGGDVVVVGDFAMAGTAAADNVARWNGATWSQVDEGTNTVALPFPLRQVVSDASGKVTATAASKLFRFETPCGASADLAGSGCASSGGDNEFVADNLPWIGATFEATGSGLPPFSFTAIVTGLSPANVPLSLVLPQGQPGCTLLASPDLIDFQIPTPAGELQTSLMIPNDLSLVGQQLYRQLVPMEVNAQLQVLELTASDALELVIGAF